MSSCDAVCGGLGVLCVRLEEVGGIGYGGGRILKSMLVNGALMQLGMSQFSIFCNWVHYTISA